MNLTKLFLFSAVMLASFCLLAQPVYQWRGTGRTGIYQEEKLLKIWPENGPALLWQNGEIGNGYGSPVITDKALFITGEIDTLAYLFCFDLKGNLQWKTNFGGEWTVSYQGSRCAPTVVGDLIYVTSGFGNLYCISAKNGEIKWSVNMLEKLHGRFTLFGHSESPLIDGDKVFLTPGGKDTNVVAINRFDGKILWVSKGIGEVPAYNSPNIIKLANRSILLTFSAYALLGLDAETGKLLWFHEQTNTPLANRKPGYGDTHSNTALFEDGCIYYVAGDGNGGVKLELSKDGSAIKQIWHNPLFNSYMGGVIKIKNNLYSCTEKKDLRCVDAMSGQFTDSLKVGTGTLICADNLFFYYNQKGEVHLIDPSNNKLKAVSKFKITQGVKEHFAHPVINKGVLYIRHGKFLMAYKVK